MPYFDYSANTPVSPAVLDCFVKTEQQYTANPNAAHREGRRAAAHLAEVTERIAALLGVPADTIVYTSGASEGNSLAIKGQVRAGAHILAGPLEHPSVAACLQTLSQNGCEVQTLSLDEDGRISLSDLAAKLRADTSLLALSVVDSELGIVQPIAQIRALLKDYPNCRLHLDATQAAGKTPLDFSLGDTLSLSAHKIYGLNGSGLLLCIKGLLLSPQIEGSGGSVRAGTPTLALAAALQTALAEALPAQPQRTAQVQAYNQALRAALSEYDKVQLNSPADAVPHILNFGIDGVRGVDLQRALDQRDIYLSVRSACATEGKPSAAVFALTGDRRRARCSVRLSLSHLTTKAEIEQFLQAFDAAYRQLVPK